MFERAEFTKPYLAAREAPYHKTADVQADAESAEAQDGMLGAGQAVWTREFISAVAPSKSVVGYVRGVGVILISAQHLQPCSPEDVERLQAERD